MHDSLKKEKWRYALREGVETGLLVAVVGTLAEVLMTTGLSFQELLSSRFLFKFGIHVVVFSAIMSVISLWCWKGNK